jgi:hypothetical protein
MKLVTIKHLDKPLNELDESQKQRFIQQLQRTDNSASSEYKFGLEMALLILGYEIKK